MLKRIFLLLILTVAGNFVFAQVRLGVRAGLHFSNLDQHKNGNEAPSSFRSGFHAGLMADCKLSDRIVVQPGVMYSIRGFRDSEAVKLNTTVRYIEVPVNIIYRHPLGVGHLLIGAGPYIAYAMGGEWNMPGRLNGSNYYGPTQGKLQFTDDTDSDNFYYITPNGRFTFGRAFDWGANTLLGYEIQKFSVQLNGQLGLANLAPKVDGEATRDRLRNMGFGLSVGYRFW